MCNVWTLLRIVRRLLALSVACAIGAPFFLSDAAEPVQPAPGAYFFMGSDDLRALRNTKPEEALGFEWELATEIIEGNAAQPARKQGLIALGSDYFRFEDRTKGMILVFDFALRRLFSRDSGVSAFENHDLLATVDFFDMEAKNRARVRKTLDVLGPGVQIAPGFEQHLYESTLRVRTESLPELKFESQVSGDHVAVRYRGEDIARFTLGGQLDRQQGEMLEKALRWSFMIHPGAVDAISPLRRAPTEIAFVHELGTTSKAKSVVRLKPTGKALSDYPLPGGLMPNTLMKSAARGDKEIESLLLLAQESGQHALNGSHTMKRPYFADYLNDAARARAAGDNFAAGLSLLAASAHYPDQAESCHSPVPPAWCATFNATLKVASEDSRFARVVEGAEHCKRHEWGSGARALADIDISGQPHGYVVSMLLFCNLVSIPANKLAGIEGLGTKHPKRAVGNAIRALSANPYIPSYYFEIGSVFAKGYETHAAWQFFELGRALGGGVKGDAFDLMLKPRQDFLLSRYQFLF